MEFPMEPIGFFGHMVLWMFCVLYQTLASNMEEYRNLQTL